MKSEFPGTEIFLDNAATKEYLEICRRALKRNPPEYFEEHQVIPMEFWQFLGQHLRGVMPEKNRVYCKLTPEEHWRAHELLVSMFKHGSAPFCIAKICQHRVEKENHPEAKSAQDYGAAQRAYNKDKTITDEGEKYPHLEEFYRGKK